LSTSARRAQVSSRSLTYDRQATDRRDDIGDYVSEGDAILVQVLRDPEEDKGAKLTGRVVLTGRDLLYSPSQAGINLSRRISDADERQRLMEVMEDVVPEDTTGGFVLRTAAQEAEAEDLEAEVSRLVARWETVEAARASGQAPACLEREMAPAFMALRDFAGTDLKSVIVDDPETLTALKAYAEAKCPMSPGSCTHTSTAIPYSRRSTLMRRSTRRSTLTSTCRQAAA